MPDPTRTAEPPAICDCGDHITDPGGLCVTCAAELRAALAAATKDRERLVQAAWEDGFDSGGDPAWLGKHYGYGPNYADDWPGWRKKAWEDFAARREEGRIDPKTDSAGQPST